MKVQVVYDGIVNLKVAFCGSWWDFPPKPQNPLTSFPLSPLFPKLHILRIEPTRFKILKPGILRFEPHKIQIRVSTFHHE